MFTVSYLNMYVETNMITVLYMSMVVNVVSGGYPLWLIIIMRTDL